MVLMDIVAGYRSIPPLPNSDSCECPNSHASAVFTKQRCMHKDASSQVPKICRNTARTKLAKWKSQRNEAAKPSVQPPLWENRASQSRCQHICTAANSVANGSSIPVPRKSSCWSSRLSGEPVGTLHSLSKHFAATLTLYAVVRSQSAGLGRHV